MTQKHKDAALKRWQSDAYREAQARATARPETHAKRSESQKAKWQDPAAIEIRSAEMQQRWQDPAYRAAQDAANAKPETHRKRSVAKQKDWADPTARANMTAGLHTPEARAKMSAKAKQRWQDKNYQQEMAAAAKDRWQDPDYRAKVEAGLTPTARAKISDANRRRPQRRADRKTSA